MTILSLFIHPHVVTNQLAVIVVRGSQKDDFEMCKFVIAMAVEFHAYKTCIVLYITYLLQSELDCVFLLEALSRSVVVCCEGKLMHVTRTWCQV